MNQEPISKHKINAIIRHRIAKGLCVRCGLDKHDGECIENYEKSDMRGIQIPKKQISKKSIETIISYRKRKHLCLKCGKDLHSGDCIENYDKSDNRDESKKIERPAIITTKKESIKTISQKIEENDVVNFKPTKEIKLFRDFIIIDISHSKMDKIIEWGAILQISKKYDNVITFVVGDILKEYNVLIYNSLRKQPQIQMLNCIDEEEYINYIASCKEYYSYPSKYTTFSILQNVDTAIFDENYNITSFLKNINYVKSKKELR